MKLNRCKGLLWSLPVFLFISCNNAEVKINPDNELLRNANSTNADSLKIFQAEFRRTLSDTNNLENAWNKFYGFALDGHAFEPSMFNLTLSMVNVKDSIAKLFDPDNQPCPIPEKVLKKLKKYKQDNKSWVPRDVARQLNQMPDQAIYLKGLDLTVLLHTIKKKSGGIESGVIAVGAPTFNNLSVADYLNKSVNNFGYTLDCSGFLNATIDGTATIPGADIKSKAAAAMDKKSSFFLGGGVIISPLYAAYFGNTSGVNLSKEIRQQILSAIVGLPMMQDGDSVQLVMSYEVIWASSRGEQSFNGSAEFSSKAGIGIGIANVQGSTGIGGTVSRNSTFSAFDTYYTSRQRLNPPVWVRISEIRARMRELTQ